MKIFVTYDSGIWNLNSWVFKENKNSVVEIIMYSSDVGHDDYAQISCDAGGLFLGMDDIGLGGIKYGKLAAKENEISSMIDTDEDVLVLADTNPASLYIYDILRGIRKSKHFHLHLWAVKPFSFQHPSERKGYEKILRNTEGLKSLTVFEGDNLLKTWQEIFGKELSSSEFGEYVSKDFARRLSEYLAILEEFSYLGSYYYEPVSGKYIETYQPPSDWEMDNTNSDRRYTTGRNYDPYAFEDYHDALAYEDIAGSFPRSDGKMICDTLRNLRKCFAWANGIEYEFKPCKYEGPCAGTCPYCEKELEELETLASNPNYPKIVIKFTPGVPGSKEEELIYECRSLTGVVVE